MAPLTISSISEAFLFLMNTPLIPPDSSSAPRDVPLTEMPASNRQSREARRQSNTSTSTSVSSQISTSTTGIPDERWTYSGSSSSHMSRTPSPVLSKELPPLPSRARHQSRVHFADDVNGEL
ncbi:hypothetical protein ACEPAI_9235 [Sanghuangporus weigelae]